METGRRGSKPPQVAEFHRWRMSQESMPVAPSALATAPAARSAAARQEKSGPPEVKDNFREIVETVVFVVVLVLLLKSFVAEAFVIPTGLMAERVWGYE